MRTSEIYRAVEDIPEVPDSLVVDLEYLGRESYMPMFIVLRAGVTLDDALVVRIKESSRRRTSARYVPTEIFAVTDVPRALTGNKMELPIRKLLLGHPLEKVASGHDGDPRLARLLRRPGAEAQPLTVATPSRYNGADAELCVERVGRKRQGHFLSVVARLTETFGVFLDFGHNLWRRVPCRS